MVREGKIGGMRTDYRHLLRPLRGAHLDRNLITEFFFVFSRFEYALKRAGYVRANRAGYAEPDWVKFGQDIQPHYNRHETTSLEEAIDYLFSEPPKRQVVGEDGSLRWEDLEQNANQTELARLLAIVRTVRNNLFHGGKYPYLPVPDPARDTRLLESGLTVLASCLNWSPRVESYYSSYLDG